MTTLSITTRPAAQNEGSAIGHYKGISAETLQTLLDVNRGEPGSNMTTIDLAYVVSNASYYRLGECRLESTAFASSLDLTELEERAARPFRIEVPPHLEIDAIWDDKTLSSGQGNNILGGNGRLILRTDRIEIPTVEATDAMLAYYGATLIEEGDIIQFPDESFPLFLMEVGKGYVSNTLMTDQGGGFYLEYHHDAPHFHMPLEGGGYYLLARWSEDGTKLQITGFEIPDGKAVYSKKGAIHCDAALTGKLIVGYTAARDCSTVLLQNEHGKRVDVTFFTS